MEISVIIPAYNAENSISATLQSVLNQTYLPTEIIVVNDGSSDCTADRVLAFGDRIKLINQENSGVSIARNRGVENCNSDWVAYLDADDIWLPEKLEMQVKLLSKHKHIKWSATRYYECLRDRKSLSNYNVPVSKDKGKSGEIVGALEAISSTSNIWVSTVVISKSLVKAAGGFHGNLSSTADNDLWFRVAKIENEIAFVNYPMAQYMVNPVGMSRAETRQISQSRFEFFDRLASHVEHSTGKERYMFKRIFARYAGQYMFNLARTGNRDASREFLQRLHEKGMPIPGLKYRWIHFVPSSLFDWLRSLKHKMGGTND